MGNAEVSSLPDLDHKHHPMNRSIISGGSTLLELIGFMCCLIFYCPELTNKLFWKVAVIPTGLLAPSNHNIPSPETQI